MNEPKEFLHPKDGKQAFRPINKSNIKDISSNKDIIYIPTKYDLDIQRYVILWEDILKEFQDALYVMDKFIHIEFIQDIDKKILEPPRISVAPDVVLDVIIEAPIGCDSSIESIMENLEISEYKSHVETNFQYLDSETPFVSTSSTSIDSEVAGGPDLSWLLQPRDKTRGVGRAIEKAKSGYADSQYDVGVVYDLFHVDLRGAVEWYHKAAIQGHARSQERLGYHYYLGYGVEMSFSLSKEWYFKAAEQNEPVAQNGCGILYNDGKAVPKDYTKAMEWYHKSAEQGYSNAQRNIGCQYAYGKSTPKDYSKAMEWYQKAASQGNSRAQNHIGALYHSGHGVTQDYQKALEWYQKSAIQGDLHAERNIGLLYNGGHGVHANHKTARNWFRKSANQGGGMAQYELGRIYFLGIDVEADVAKGIEWFKKAAKQGSCLSQFTIGMIYFQGNGVPLDYSKALDYFHMAALSGKSESQYFLGIQYSEGIGTPVFPMKAKEWFQKKGDYAWHSNNVLRKEKKKHFV